MAHLTTTLPAWTPTTDHGSDKSFFTFLETMVSGHATQSASSFEQTNNHAPCTSTTPVLTPASSDSVRSAATTEIRPRTPISKRRPPARQRGSTHRPSPKSVHRSITNDTYLRRLHLSRQQTVALFPRLKQRLLSTMVARLSQKQSQLVKLAHDFDLVSSVDGARWPMSFECSVSGGKMHCRLVAGWSRFCRDNGVCVGDGVRLDASKGDNVVFVCVERKEQRG